GPAPPRPAPTRRPATGHTPGWAAFCGPSVGAPYGDRLRLPPTVEPAATAAPAKSSKRLAEAALSLAALREVRTKEFSYVGPPRRRAARGGPERYGPAPAAA